jgi:hypothetical protein
VEVEAHPPIIPVLPTRRRLVSRAQLSTRGVSLWYGADLQPGQLLASRIADRSGMGVQVSTDTNHQTLTRQCSACGQDQGTGASHSTAGSLSLTECLLLRIAG